MAGVKCHGVVRDSPFQTERLRSASVGRIVTEEALPMLVVIGKMRRRDRG